MATNKKCFFSSTNIDSKIGVFGHFANIWYRSTRYKFNFDFQIWFDTDSRFYITTDAIVANNPNRRREENANKEKSLAMFLGMESHIFPNTMDLVAGISITIQNRFCQIDFEVTWE